MNFFDKPIINSPYKYPNKHWELNKYGQPIQSINESRRTSSLITPVPRAKKKFQSNKDEWNTNTNKIN